MRSCRSSSLAPLGAAANLFNLPAWWWSVNLAVASKPTPGTRLTALHLRVVEWPLLSQPADGFADIDAVAGRVVRSALQPGEPVTEARLAATDARGGLASIITPGKRAVSVRVNDVVGVAGFALPGSFVDVMVSARDASEKPFSRTVLERVRVLAAAQETWADPAKPKLVNAVTLELSPSEAERLDLARTVGTLSLVLRNELDDGAHTSGERSAGARLTDLVASVAPAAVSAVRAASRPPRVLTGRAPRPSSLSAVEPSAGAANDAPATFEEIRGTRRTIVNEATP
ncbi:MAG: Flp pilus assembly protein CpaB [Burkholderiales bacterium]